MGLSGKLEDLSLADIFQILSIGKKSGSLFISSSRHSSGLIFRNGLVVWADSDLIEGDIMGDLLEAGLLKEEFLQAEESDSEGGERIKTLKQLVSEGLAGAGQVERITRKRIERIVYKLLLNQVGDFRFEPNQVSFAGSGLHEPEWEIEKGLSPEYLILEGARVYDEIHQYGRILNEEMETDPAGGEWAESEDAVPWEISSLRNLTQELRFPETPSEISLLVLRYASEVFERAIFFIIHRDHLAGFGQFGLEGEQPDERVREIFLDYRRSDFMKGIISRGISYRGEIPVDAVTGGIVREMGEGWPAEAALFPVTAEGEVVALLYCDNQPSGEDIPETPGLEIFVTQAGLALEKAMLKKKLSERGE